MDSHDPGTAFRLQGTLLDHTLDDLAVLGLVIMLGTTASGTMQTCAMDTVAFVLTGNVMDTFPLNVVGSMFSKLVARTMLCHLPFSLLLS